MTALPDYFVKAMRAEPADDAPRLVAADWFQENGDESRAEFVRVQVELAKWEMTPGERYDGIELPDGRRMEFKPTASLIRREKELYGRFWWDWCPDGFKYDTLENPAVTWRRGFLERVTATASQWLALGDNLYAREPVTAVALTTWPGQQVRVVDLPGGVPVLDDRSPGVRYLDDRWPGVAFTLPEPVISAEWDTATADIPAALRRLRELADRNLSLADLLGTASPTGPRPR
jgi:uncharacterized protein (TIGR02996 family)